MTIDQEVVNLKALVKEQRLEAAYGAGSALLTRAPGHEYGSYATAWAASRLGKHDEAVQAIAPALQQKPDNPNYLSLRAQTLLKLGRQDEALPDFLRLAQLRPEVPATWKALLKIRAESRPGLELPRNLPVVTEELVKAYRTRQWDACERCLAELAVLEPLTHRYWQLTIDEFLSRLPDACTAWREFHQEVTARFADTANPVSPLVDRGLAYNAFLGYFGALVKEGDVEAVLRMLPDFRRVHARACPAPHLAGAAALLVRHHRYAECLAALDAAEAELPDEAARGHFRLQVYASRWASRQGLLEGSTASTANALSDGLVEEMMGIARPESPQKQVLDDFLRCWAAIRARGDRLLLDVRFNPGQLAALKDMILQALADRRGFSLVRLGDGESYGFREVVPQLYASEPKLDIDRSVETIWWGGGNPPNRDAMRAGLLAALASADVIGFPGPLRVARDLGGGRVVQNQLPSVLELKYRVVFQGMQSLVESGRVGQPCTWVDEFCNIVVSDPQYVASLLRAAQSVVVVGCFDIPAGHVLDDPKVKLVPVPPVSKAASIGTRQFGSTTLPEILGRVEDAVARASGPGTLVLVSAGFAGKGLLAIAKAAGAVAIDFGSGMDSLMGHHTRSLELGVQASAVVPRDYAPSAAKAFSVALGPERRFRMEDLNQSGRGPLYIHDRARLATATSVRLLSPDTLVCCSFVGRRAYLVKFDYERGTHEVLDSVDTTYGGVTVETDCCAADAHGHMVTTNFYQGTATLYRCEGGRIRHVRDLPLNLGGFVHGIKFYRPGVIAVTGATGVTGLHFFDLETCEPLLHVPSDIKAQDVCFLSDGKMVLLGAKGSPKKQLEHMYDSEVQLIDFNLEDRTFRLVASATFEQAHLDCCESRDGRVYISDQFNNRVLVLDAQTLEPVGEVGGYDFPHGVDIGFDLLAVSNYGRNDVTLQRFLPG